MPSELEKQAVGVREALKKAREANWKAGMSFVYSSESFYKVFMTVKNIWGASSFNDFYKFIKTNYPEYTEELETFIIFD